MSHTPHGALNRTAIFVDTDVGCDDAIALAWLLGWPEAEIVGLSSVFGNSSVQNTTANLLTLLDALDCDVPVTIGASGPLVYLRTRAGALTHGPDGLWGNQQAHDLTTLPVGAPGAIAAAARACPELTVLALGPLTNIARAVQAYPEDLAGVRLVALAGSRGAGTVTPAAEFNVFADPHALTIVLESNMRVELVTRDAFQELRLDELTARRMELEGGPGGTLLGRVLEAYVRAISRHGGAVPIPDAVAAIYAVYPRLGTVQSATVRVVTEGELTRGQTIVATSERHQATLALGASGLECLASHIGTPGFDHERALRDASTRAPHNATVVVKLDVMTTGQLLDAGLMALRRVRSVGE